MTPPRHPPRGSLRLRRQLTLRLMLPLIAIVVATAALGTVAARRLTDSVFDRWLFDAAQSVAPLIRFEDGRARLDLPAEAERLLLYDEVDRTYFSVGQGNTLLAGTAGIADSGSRLHRSPHGSAFTTTFGGVPVRVALVDLHDDAGHHATVKVAETLQKRQRVERDLQLMLLPMAALVLAAAASISLAIRRTVQPLEDIAQRWNQRAQASLDPVDDEGLPGELLPFADALNELLARIRAMLERERHFAATAAHQLRTPLTGLQLGLARAAAAPDLSEARAVIRELESSTQRAAHLVQQLLLLGRLEMGGANQLSRELIDLVPLVQDVGAAHMDQALAKGLQLELHADSAPVLASVHVELLIEALGNLLDNAIRYAPSGSEVWVEVGDHPPRLAVHDGGPGVAPEDRALILERFKRGRSAPSGGTGLGLAVVRDIARLHEAKLELGQSPLGGLCVTLEFPAPRGTTTRQANGIQHRSCPA